MRLFCVIVVGRVVVCIPAVRGRPAAAHPCLVCACCFLGMGCFILSYEFVLVMNVLLVMSVCIVMSMFLRLIL